MHNFSKVQAFENQLAGAKAQVALGEAINKLLSNKEFRRVIMDEFTVKEAARFAAASADPALGAREQADALAIAQAGGHLKRWITIQLQLAETSGAQLEELQEGLEEARNEEANPTDSED